MSTPLAIAIACFPSFGGSGVIASELAVGLARRGHRVHVLASAPPSRPLPRCERLSFHEIAVPSYPLLEHAPYALALASGIVELARAQPLDILHVHYAVPHAASAQLARQALGSAAPRVVTTLHGTDVTGLGSHPSYRAITRSTVEAADAVTVPSAHLKAEAYRLLGLAPHVVIDVIPNFVDAEHFVPRQAPSRKRLHELLGFDIGTGPLLFHASNFRAVKRVSDLFEVLARVRKQLPARLLLVGDGPEMPLADRRARELGVHEHVLFLGRRAEFVEYLQHADVFVLPSETESFGLAALEALSAGIPVCGYRVGGLRDVVSEDVGRLVEPLDVDALALAVLDVISDPERRRKLGTAARARVLERFRAEPALDHYEALYERVLTGRA